MTHFIVFFRISALILGVGKIKKSIVSGDASTPAVFNVQSYFGTYLISFVSVGESVLLLIGWGTHVEIAHTGDANQYYNIVIHGGDVTISAKSGVEHPIFYVYRV